MEDPVKLQLAPWARLANYKGGVKTASVLPNRPACSAAMTGHAAFGTSRCATSAIQTYLHTDAGAGAWHDLPRRRATLSRKAISGLPAMRAPAHAAWSVPRIAAGS